MLHDLMIGSEGEARSYQSEGHKEKLEDVGVGDGDESADEGVQDGDNGAGDDGDVPLQAQDYLEGAACKKREQK